MKAALLNGYDKNGRDLEVGDIPVPEPAAGEVLVREDGASLVEVSRIFGERRVQVSVDEVFELADVNAALAKVASGGSRGKTVLWVM